MSANIVQDGLLRRPSLLATTMPAARTRRTENIKEEQEAARLRHDNIRTLIRVFPSNHFAGTFFTAWAKEAQLTKVPVSYNRFGYLYPLF